MDFFAAVDQTISTLRTPAQAESSVPAALSLAVYAWQHCRPAPQHQADWDLFGTAVVAAIDQLSPYFPQPPVITIERRTLLDTAQVRAAAAKLARHTARRVAQGSNETDSGRRWAAETAAANLRQAAAFLTDAT